MIFKIGDAVVSTKNFSVNLDTMAVKEVTGKAGIVISSILDLEYHNIKYKVKMCDGEIYSFTNEELRPASEFEILKAYQLVLNVGVPYTPEDEGYIGCVTDLIKDI